MNYTSTVQFSKGKVASLLDCFIYATIDPGGGTSEANATSKTDKAGWTVGAVTASADFLILEAGEKHMEVSDILKLIYRMHFQWRPKHIGVERMMYLQQYLLSEMQHAGKLLPLFTLQHKGRSKSERIKATIPYLAQTYFTAEAQAVAGPAFARWFEKMLHGDDWIDSYAYFYDIATPPSVNNLPTHRAERERWARDELIDQLDPRSQREARAALRIESNRKGGYHNELSALLYD